MPKFDFNQIKELKAYVQTRCFHDAQIILFEHNRTEKQVLMKLNNPSWHDNIEIVFQDVSLLLFMRGDWGGNECEIYSATVEDDFSPLEKVAIPCKSKFVSSIYFLFGMFSGDELHIVAKSVFIKDN